MSAKWDREVDVAYIDFPDTMEGVQERKAFWLSDDGIQLVAGWRREGAGLERIAHLIGISETTLRKWRNQEPRLEAAIRQTDELVNALVENALLRRALGYTTMEVVTELVEGEMREVRRVEKPVPPDTKACLAWLYSRRSDRWRTQQAPIDASAEEIAAVRDVLVTIATTADTVPREALPEAQEGE